jgi:hypothetical protein
VRFTKGVWARRARGDFHPLGPPYGQAEQILSKLLGLTEHFLSAYVVLLVESGALGQRSAERFLPAR